MEDDIRKLIDTYEQLLHEHKYPIDMTTKEQHRLDGYDAALLCVIYDLKCILYRGDRGFTLKEKLAYTE